MSNLPPTYRVQDGCHNCRWLYSHYEFPSELPTMLCTLGGKAPVRPKLEDYVSHKAGRRSIGDAELNKLSRADRRYANALRKLMDSREVDPTGICDQHEGRAQ